MSVSVQVGLVLSILTAFGSVAGFLYKFRGAREAPAVDLRRPLHSSVELFRSPLYSLGILIALGSWGLHVGALALAPISLVQSVIAGGLVLLTFVADRLFGIEVQRREWIGVGLTAAGLAFLAATLGGVANSSFSRYPPGTLAVWLTLVSAAGLMLALSSRAALLAVSAGLLWAASDTSIKALSSHLHGLGAGVIVHPLAFVILIASLIGLLVSARSLQLGEAVPMIATDQRRGEPDHDRGGSDRVRRAAAVGQRPARPARAGLRARDRRRRAHAAADGLGGEPPELRPRYDPTGGPGGANRPAATRVLVHVDLDRGLRPSGLGSGQTRPGSWARRFGP